MGMGQFLKEAISKIVKSDMKPIIKYPLIGVLMLGLGAAVFYGVA